MPSIAARSIITTALRLLGVASAQQPLHADMAESGLDALNTMLDSWSTEKLLTYTRPLVTLTLVPGQGVYTWGQTTPASDIPQVPPVRLEVCLLHLDDTAPALEWPLQILSQTEYAEDVWMKNLTNDYPSHVFLEASQPVARLYVYPVPTRAYQLEMLPWMAHSPYSAYDAVLDWPSGHQRAFQFNLALELAPQYGIEPSPMILRTAEESKRALYVINAEVGRLSLRPGRPVGTGGLSYPRGFREGW